MAGFAYTEVEEELVNEGSSPIEVTASFRAPPGGVIVRMALWVDDRWMEAEVAPHPRAAEVYEGIVVGRRDPALLEQAADGSLKLRVFPVPTQGSRRVVVGYAQPLLRQEGRYHFELGLQLPAEAPSIRELSAEVDLVGVEAPQVAVLTAQPPGVIEPGPHGTWVRWGGELGRPRDLRVSFAAPSVTVSTFSPMQTNGGDRFVALRIAPDLAAKAPAREASVWVIDTSVGQSEAALEVTKAIITRLLKALPAGERFAILACDTACVGFPQQGLASARADSRRDARRFVAGLEARGASDVGYALFEGLRRARGLSRAQLVYFGDGRATAGDLEPGQILERLSGRGQLLDLRMVGAGWALDPGVLSALAARLTAAQTTAIGDSSESESLARWLAEPILRAPSLLLPQAFELAYPQQLPNLVRGDELLVLARLGRQTAGALGGQLSGAFDNGTATERQRSELRFELPGRALQADTAPQLWAHARLRDLDDDQAPRAEEESVALSMRYQILSRRTSLLALESDAMFRTFGIAQRHRVRAPALRLGATVVSGRLPAEPIQETVRRNDGRFRACYHDGLLRNSALAGTVTTRFVIGRDGKVATATDSGSTLSDRAVVDCIVRAFKELVFPAPEDPVTVVYPFALSPSKAKERRLLPAPWRPREAPVARLAGAAPPRVPPPHPKAAELAAKVELDPNSAELQLAAAVAYEAERSERRACSHFRAAAALAPADLATQYQALRCRARVLNERIAVLADITRGDLRSPAIDALAARIRSLADIPVFATE